MRAEQSRYLAGNAVEEEDQPRSSVCPADAPGSCSGALRETVLDGSWCQGRGAFLDSNTVGVVKFGWQYVQ